MHCATCLAPPISRIPNTTRHQILVLHRPSAMVRSIIPLSTPTPQRLRVIPSILRDRIVKEVAANQMHRITCRCLVQALTSIRSSLDGVDVPLCAIPHHWRLHKRQALARLAEVSDNYAEATVIARVDGHAERALVHVPREVAVVLAEEDLEGVLPGGLGADVRNGRRGSHFLGEVGSDVAYCSMEGDVVDGHDGIACDSSWGDGVDGLGDVDIAQSVEYGWCNSVLAYSRRA
jgi:hypothetical protein